MIIANNQAILRIAVATPLRRLFDYLPPQDVDTKELIPGLRIKIPFQSRTLVGILISIENQSDLPYEKLKRALEVLEKKPLLPKDIFDLCTWAADYYHYSLGEVFATALPTFLRKGKDLEDKLVLPKVTVKPELPLNLNASQACAVKAINEASNQFQVFLLDGVTGSGKTEVYLQAIEKQLQDDKKQILVLVPEINLTPQTIARFSKRFSVPVIAIHSNLTDKTRLKMWQLALSGKARIVIGTRSAIFTPMPYLSLIIVDEEHDMSFKQQDRFRYHARDLAIMRANLNQIPIVLGSATPSLESLLNIKRQKYTLLTLPERAGVAVKPSFQLVNISNDKNEHGLSKALLTAMQAHLHANNQVMLFLNRRGFAPVYYCTSCRWVATCKRCDARMVYHHKPAKLHCHHCDGVKSLPTRCEECKETALQPVGLGTQRLEETLKIYFPDIPIIRVDRDSTKRKGEMEVLLERIHSQEKAILLGTQMLAKGHHFPNVTLVGMIDADSGLFSADFRAAEQMGQLLLQVSGRAGREEKPGTVLIQTRHPEHPLLQTLIQQGYAIFADNLLQEREQGALPPFTYHAVLRAESYQFEEAEKFLTAAKTDCLKQQKNIMIYGPISSLLPKKKGLHHRHLLIKSNNRRELQVKLKQQIAQLETLAKQYSVKWILEVDPVEI